MERRSGHGAVVEWLDTAVHLLRGIILFSGFRELDP